MNYENFTIKVQEALQESSSIANKNDNAEISPEHLLQALLEQQDGLIVPVVERIGVNAVELNNKVKDLVRSNPKVTGAAQVYFSSQLQKILANAEKEMAAFKDQYLSTEHLLLAMSEADGQAGDLLRKCGITHKAIVDALKAVRGNQTVDSQDPESTMRSLEKYCRDLTAAARQDKIDPVIGRDEEIRRVMQVL